MGRVMGKVRFVKDNMMAWFMYNGQSDFAWPRLFKNYKEFYEIAWENDEGYNYLDDDKVPHKCTCGEDEEVEIYESSVSGTIWKGRACRKCMVITKNLDSDEYSNTLNEEEFDKWLKIKEFPEWCGKGFMIGE